MQACPMFTTLLTEALALVRACPCTEESGCPGCVQFAHCSGYNTKLDKRAAILVLDATLQQELALAQAAPATRDSCVAGHAVVSE